MTTTNELRMHARLKDLEFEYGQKLDPNFDSDPGCGCETCFAEVTFRARRELREKQKEAAQ